MRILSHVYPLPPLLDMSPTDLLLTLIVVVAVNGYMPPPYFTSSLKTSYYILPCLQYNETILEPLLSTQSFTSRYNGAFKKYQSNLHKDLSKLRKEESNEFTTGPILDIIRNLDKVSENVSSLSVSLGGFMNQACVFACMSYNKYEEQRLPEGTMESDIEIAFMTYTNFKASFTDAAMNIIGSGYVWLVRTNKHPNSKLKIITTANEDSPLSEGMIPVLVIDMWERAYYEQFSWDREAYIKNWWKLIDWDEADDMAYFFSHDKLNPKSKKNSMNITKDFEKEDAEQSSDKKEKTKQEL